MNYAFIFVITLILISCNSEKPKVETPKSVHPFANYFYPYDSSARIFCYRNISDGLTEEFHRVYGYKDSKGYHIGVDRLTPDGQRLVESLVYNYDSLDVHLQMETFSTGMPKPTLLKKNKLIPWGEKSQSYFSSIYPSRRDSLEINEEWNRTFIKKLDSFVVINNERRKAIVFSETRKKRRYFKLTNKDDNTEIIESTSIFAEGFGLVEFYDKDKKTHYKLEKVITQK